MTPDRLISGSTSTGNNGRSPTFDLFSVDTAEGRSDIANGRRFSEHHRNKVRWVHAWKKWVAYDGRRWKIDDDGRVARLGKGISDLLWVESRKSGNKRAFAFAARSAESGRVNAMLTMASTEPEMSITPEQLDRDPWLLNCEDGTLHLRTGRLRQHNRDDFLTKLAPIHFDYERPAPLWLQFLDDVLASKAELIGYMQRLIGYSLTGTTSEHVLLILYGTGANGKSVFVNTILSLLGQDYCLKAPSDLLLAKQGAHPTERADLFGKRFIATNETDDGRRLSEALVKELTGGDKVRARRMREDFWEFSPTHKIWLATNHKPQVRGTDHGIWRRLKVVPFTVTIPNEQQDKQLETKLLEEKAGILAWAVRGCIDWQRSGLQEPEVVTRATDEFRHDQDLIGSFIDDRCEEWEDAEIGATWIYRTYVDWCRENGEEELNQRRFGQALTERGIGKRKSGGSIMRLGLRLKIQGPLDH